VSKPNPRPPRDFLGHNFVLHPELCASCGAAFVNGQRYVCIMRSWERHTERVCSDCWLCLMAYAAEGVRTQTTLDEALRLAVESPPGG